MYRTTSSYPFDPSAKTRGRAVEGPSQGMPAPTGIGHLPKEVGILLLVTGTVTGMLPPPPGPFDLSLMLAGVQLCGRAAFDRWRPP